MSRSSLPDLDLVLGELQESVTPPRDRGGTEEIPQDTQTSSAFSFTHIQPPSSLMVDTLNKGESSTSSPTSLLTSSSASTKYRLWVTPEDQENPCYRLIGQGSTFCIQSSCSTNHRSTKHFHPLPGEIYVLKTSTSAFKEPSLKSEILGDSLTQKWLLELCTLEEWSHRFLLVQQEEKDPTIRQPTSKIFESDLEAKQNERELHKSFKTPSKKKFIQPDQLKKDHTEFQILFPDKNIKSEPISPKEISLQNIMEKIDLISRAIERVYYTQQQDNSVLMEGLRSLDTRIDDVSDQLGSKVVLDSQFQAPNIWLTLATIVDEIKANSSANHEDHKEKFDKIQESVRLSQSLLEKRLLDHATLQMEPILLQLNQLNSFVVEASRTLNKKILDLSVGSSQLISHISRQEYETQENMFNKRIGLLESELNILRSQHDSSVIKFGQLGFRSNKECDAWMESHHPGEDFGLLIDLHLLLEHVFVQMTGQKLISNLEQIHKMKLRSNNQALAISSFESRLPRIFTLDSKSPIRKDESYFPSIKNWDDWDLPNDGYRDRLNIELHLFKTGHQETLEAELVPLSPFYNLCILALTESVSWMEGLMKFLDDTYNEYSRSRYSPKKAWHITTRLARALIEKVSAPRNSIHNSFRINNPSGISKSICYATLRSLDIMTEISSDNFKNSPIITSELSKFLALNTNYEMVEMVQEKLKLVETDAAQLKREVKGAVSTANTASNKWDTTFKTSIDDVKRRLKALEQRS